MKNHGVFITFEGTDGVGKSTQLDLARQWLVQQGYDVLTTREPGGGEVAERIRQIVLDPALNIENLTELFLYQASRVEHLSKIIRPALAGGKIILCDRFTDSTIAYQGAGRGLMQQSLLLNKIATGGLKPDLTILLTLPAEVCWQRAIRRHAVNGGDRLENEGLMFQKKVEGGFRQLAKKEPKRIKVIPAQESIEETQKRVRIHIQKKLHEYSRSISRS